MSPIDLITLVVFPAIPIALLVAMVMVPNDNGEAERRRAFRQMMQLRNKRGYTPCGRRRDGQKW